MTTRYLYRDTFSVVVVIYLYIVSFSVINLPNLNEMNFKMKIVRKRTLRKICCSMCYFLIFMTFQQHMTLTNKQVTLKLSNILDTTNSKIISNSESQCVYKRTNAIYKTTKWRYHVINIKRYFILVLFPCVIFKKLF